MGEKGWEKKMHPKLETWPPAQSAGLLRTEFMKQTEIIFITNITSQL